MPRRAVLAGTLAALLAVGVAAARAQTQVFHSRVSGLVAIGFWTTLPANPVPGVVYKNTQVSTGELLSNEGGVRQLERFIGVDEYRYSFDEQGEVVPLTATNSVGLVNPSLAIDARLRSASAQATLQRVTCDVQPPAWLGPSTIILCGPDHSPLPDASVSMTLTGVGEVGHQPMKDPFISSPCLTLFVRANDKLRHAVATATYDGQDLGASNLDLTVIFHVAEALFSAEHFPNSTQPDCFPPRS
jgi:hypothetical protein